MANRKGNLMNQKQPFILLACLLVFSACGQKPATLPTPVPTSGQLAQTSPSATTQPAATATFTPLPPSATPIPTATPTVFPSPTFIPVQLPSSPKDLTFSRLTSPRNIGTLAWSPDGTMLAGSSWDYTVTLWDVANKQQIRLFQSNLDQIFGLAWSPDGQMLANGSLDQTVLVWEPKSGKRLATLEHASRVNSLTFSPDGRFLAVGLSGKTVQIWETSNWSEVLTLEGYSQGVSKLAFSPDGQVLASAAFGKKITLWKMSEAEGQVSFELLPALSAHSKMVTGLKWSPVSPNLLASASDDGTLILWDTLTGSPIRTLQGWGQIKAITWSPDGRYLAAQGFDLPDYTVILWETATGTELFRLEKVWGMRTGLAWSPDGRQLAGAMIDGVILWNISK